jgi:urea transporter
MLLRTVTLARCPPHMRRVSLRSDLLCRGTNGGAEAAGGRLRLRNLLGSSNQVHVSLHDEKEHRRNFSSMDRITKSLETVQDPSLKGIGQVIFLNSPRAGGLLLASLAVGDPFLACMAATGSLASTLTSQQACLSKNAMMDGLHSYNGCLVGCATAVFVAPEATLTALTVTLAGASASTMVAASLTNMFKMPQWTYAFNIVTLTILLRLQPFQTAAAVDSTGPVPTTAPFASLLMSPFKGLSQVFVVESTLTGLGIAAAVASYSPMLAGHALMGSSIGCITGWVLSAPSADIAAGLWGFNPALTSMGVGVFFVHNRSSVALSAGGAFATACCFGALQPVFGMAGAPCLTLPFCFTMTACYHLHSSIQGLTLAKNPHSPEKNTSYI